MSDLKPGDFIPGEYRVRRVFGAQGKSGMGVVYLVEAEFQKSLSFSRLSKANGPMLPQLRAS